MRALTNQTHPEIIYIYIQMIIYMKYIYSHLPIFIYLSGSRFFTVASVVAASVSTDVLNIPTPPVLHKGADLRVVGLAASQPASPVGEQTRGSGRALCLRLLHLLLRPLRPQKMELHVN